MKETRTATVEPIGLTNVRPMPPGHVLIDVRAVAAKYGCDERSIFRWAGTRIPFGIKLGSLRRWDVAEIDAHIANGAKPIRTPGKVGQS